MERYALLHSLQKQRQFAQRMAPSRPLSAYAARRLRVAEAIGPAARTRTENSLSWRSVPAEEARLSASLEAIQPSLEQFASQAEENEPAELVVQESAPAAAHEVMESVRLRQTSIEPQHAPAPERAFRPAAKSAGLPAREPLPTDETSAEERIQAPTEQSEERQTVVPPALASSEHDALARATLAHETPRVEQQEKRQPASQPERPGPRRARIEERPQLAPGQYRDLVAVQHPENVRPAAKAAPKVEAQKEAEREAAELFTASESRSPQEWFALLAQARQQSQPIRQQMVTSNAALEGNTKDIRANIGDAGAVNTRVERVRAKVIGTNAQAVRTDARVASAGVGSVRVKAAEAMTASAGMSDEVGARFVRASVGTARSAGTGALTAPVTNETGLRGEISAYNAEEVPPVLRESLSLAEPSVKAEEASLTLREASDLRGISPDLEETSLTLHENSGLPESPAHRKGGPGIRPNVPATRPSGESEARSGLDAHSDDAGIDADRARATDVEPVSMRAREALKPLVGFDPADARIHRGPAAARFVAAQRADAVTLGDDIFLAAGHASDEPQTLGLLAHELTHVARQHKPRHVPPVVEKSAVSESSAQAGSTEDPQQMSPGSNGFLVSVDEEELAEQVERQVTRQAKESAQAPGVFAPMSIARASALSNTRENIARSGWGGLPAPWEPLPDWLASSTPTDGFEQFAGTPQTRPSLPSLPTGSGNGQGETHSNSPASAAGGKTGGGQAAPTAQRAGLERSLHGDGTQTPRQEAIPQQQSEPEPDLDKLARQVYAVLKRRLDVERRRMS